MIDAAGAGLNAFVGRQREFGVLLRLLDRAEAGQGGVVMVVGEAGIGKTRTTRELATVVSSRGWLVLWGRCFEGDWPRPYGPWVEALAGHARRLGRTRLDELLGQGVVHLARLLPDLAAPGESPTESTPVLRDQVRLFEAVAALLTDAARKQPVLLVLDDLHWADRDSLRLLRHLIGTVDGTETPLLLVGMYRDSDVDEAHPLRDTLADLARVDDHQRILLRGLDEDEVAHYLATATDVAASRDLAQQLWAETEGNPFYVRELLRFLIEEGRLRAQDDGAPVVESHGLGVPAGVRQVVERRVSRLSSAAQAALRIAAVFPRGFELSVLQTLVDESDERLLDVLDEARRSGLIRAVAGRPGWYRFAHAIVRHAIYDGLSADQRARLHYRAAETLSRLDAADPETYLPDLAYHHAEALPVGDARKAFDYAVRAGAWAARLLGYEEAARHYERAVGILDSTVSDDAPPSPEDELRRCDVLLALGETLRRSGNGALARSSPAKAALLEVASIARRLRPYVGANEAGIRLARAALNYRGGLIDAGVVDTVRVRLIEEALDSLDGRDSALRARLMARLAAELYFSDQPERRIALSRGAVAMARRVGDPSALAYTLETSHLARWGPDNVGERIAITAEILTLAERLHDPELTLLGQGWRVTDLLELGEIGAVDAAIAAHARLAAELRQPFFQFNSVMWRSMRAILDGRFAEGEELANQMLSLGRQIQDPDAELMFGIQLLLLRREQGRLDELEAAMRSSSEQRPRLRSARRRLAYIYAEQGRTDEARAELESIATHDLGDLTRDLTWLSSVTALADVCAFLGDTDRAETLYTLLLPYGDRVVVIGHAIGCNGAVSRSLGRLAGLLGRREEATQHFEDALGRHMRLRARPLLARTQYEYAAWLLSDGRPGGRRQPLELLSQARATACELGMARLVAQVDTLERSIGPSRMRRDAGERPARPLVDGPAIVLSPREREVAALVAHGYSNRQIADALVVAEGTAVNHVKHILAKLQLTSRTQLAAWAVRQGTALER